MQAIGGYFRGLREAQDLSPSEVAARLKERLRRNVDQSTIWRVETARMVPAADLLLAMLAVLKGRAADLADLSARAEASAADGEELGRKVVSGQYAYLTDDELALFNQLNPRQREAALQFFRQMIGDTE